MTSTTSFIFANKDYHRVNLVESNESNHWEREQKIV